MSKETLNNITPLTVQSAARMSMHKIKGNQLRKKETLEQWRKDREDPVKRKQRRLVGLKQHSDKNPQKTGDFHCHTIHPSKLLAFLQMQKRILGLTQHHAAANSSKAVAVPPAQFLYRTIHPSRVNILKLGRVQVPQPKRTKDLGKLFRSVSESAVTWSSPRSGTDEFRRLGTDEFRRRVITTTSA